MIRESDTSRVRSAIARSKKLMPDYWRRCLHQRSASDPLAAGSVHKQTPDSIEKALLGAVWVPYEHSGVAYDCTAFSAPVPGLSGTVRLGNLEDNHRVTLIDPKHTGFVEASVSGVRDKKYFSVIILGTDGGSEVVFTFHPGAPIKPSQIPADGNVGRTVTAAEAVKLGLVWAKVAS